MRHLAGSPTSFLVIGFSWLLLFSLVGLAILIGLVRGTPLPSWLRLVHAHGVLIGGLVQLMIGGLLAWVSSQRDSHQSDNRFWLFIGLNVAVIALLAGFAMQDMRIVGVAGIVFAAAIASLADTVWRRCASGLGGPNDSAWVYRLALLALFGGLVIGIAMAFRLLPEYYAHARLLHLHLILLGFVTVTLAGLLHRFLPDVLQTGLYSPFVSRLVMWMLPAGFVILLGGFVMSSLRLELAVGGLLVFATGLYAYNLFRTWMHSGHPGSAASDHLLLATFFLLLAMPMGLLIGANSLPEQSILPIGSLHLAAYTHMAMIGFILHTICGGLSYGIPLMLAESRVPNQKKRGPYREQLETIMGRWRIIQLVGLSLGTMGLGLIAALTWSVPLASTYIQLATWTTVGLLLAGLTWFAAKLAWVFGTDPAD